MTGRLCLCLLGAALLSGCASPQGKTLNQKRYDTLRMRNDTLSTLRDREPDVAEELRLAPGVGVFESFGVTVGPVGGANGYGVVTDAAGNDHYMRFAGLKLGIGLGGKVYRIVIVFNDPEVLTAFINGGWSAGGQAQVAAKNASDGGARRAATDFTEPIEVYHITDGGLIAEAVIEGARFYRDGDLNID